MWQEQDKLASNFPAFLDAFEGVEVDWQIGVVTTDMWDAEGQGTLLGGDDEVELQNPDGQSIDRVAWDSSWGMSEGVAHQLDPAAMTSSNNDSADNWCPAVDGYGDGDLGIPVRRIKVLFPLGPHRLVPNRHGLRGGFGNDGHRLG